MSYDYFFEIKPFTSLQDVKDAFSRNNVVFAYFTNGILEHEVVVLGIDHTDNNGHTILNYYNPTTGIIEKSDSSKFNYECEIEDIDPAFRNTQNNHCSCN